MILRRRRLTLALIVGGLVTVSWLTLSLFGLFRPAAPSIPAHVSTHDRTVSSAPPAPVSAPVTAELMHTNDPIAYAKALTKALFVWDTMSGLTPVHYQSVIGEDADPSGVDADALVSDLAAYYPTEAQWQQLQQYKTTSSVIIDRAYIPAAWGRIVAAHPSSVRPGTTVVNVEAIRHRTGEWFGEPAVTNAPISFSIFIGCQPTFSRCHVLRLSGVNTPLK